MKFSCANLISLYSVLSLALVFADDVPTGNKEELDAKWLYNGGLWNNYWRFSNAGYLLNNPGLWNGWTGFPLWGPSSFAFGVYNAPLTARRLWFKSVDEGHQERRSIDLGARSNLIARDADSFTCKNLKNEPHTFSIKECKQAAAQLAESHLSSASSGGCTVSLKSPTGPVAAKNVPAAQLQKVVEGVLKACGQNSNKLLSASELSLERRSPAEAASAPGHANEKETVALIISKA